MAATAVLVFSDGKLEVPAEVQEELHLTEGTKLQVTVLAEEQMPAEDGNSWDARSKADWKWVPNDDWRSLQGMLSGSPEHDTTRVRAAERAWELEHDERKFGPFPQR